MFEAEPEGPNTKLQTPKLLHSVTHSPELLIKKAQAQFRNVTSEAFPCIIFIRCSILGIYIF